jgi:ribosomal-protein-alanine N-acetyltransferase
VYRAGRFAASTIHENIFSGGGCAALRPPRWEMKGKPMKILETQRLILRRLVPGDLDRLFALYSDQETRQYFPEGRLTYEETKEELEWFLNGHPDHPELGLWATIHKPTNEFIGRCGLLPWTIDEREEVEVAYLLDKAYWRQGLGTEAAQAIAQYAFDQLHLARLICLIDRENQASIKVAQNIGMTFEKEGVDNIGPFLLYSMRKQLSSSQSSQPTVR